MKVILTELAKELKATQGIDVTPRQAYEDDAGYDLCACIESTVFIGPGKVVKIPTGCKIYIGGHSDSMLGYTVKPAGLYMPRSSNPGLQLTNTIGLLDAGYQGESFIKYRNTTKETITIAPGEKIAQLVLILTLHTKPIIVESFDESTERGSGGDGSSGRM